MYERSLSTSHLSTLSAICDLGDLCRKQGRLAEVEEKYHLALQESERIHGVNNLSTLRIAHCMGLLYKQQKRLVEAEEMGLRALQGYEIVLGAHHISTLRTIVDLGEVYRQQGTQAGAEEQYQHTYLAKAEKSYQRALEGYERTLDADDPSTLATTTNLGTVYTILRREC